MKSLVATISSLLFLLSGFGQTIQVTTGKTTSLVFPFPVLHADRGNKDILVQPLEKAGNILLLKAATRDLAATNLSVVVSDGSVYSFDIVYADNPPQWVYEIPARLHGSVQGYARSILSNSRSVHGIISHNWDITAKITGIYSKDEVLYYQLQLLNHSTIDFGIDFLRFYIRDTKKARRTAQQETELKPLWVAGNNREVKANAQTVIVIGLAQCTLADRQYLAVEINEKNGGRNLKMKIGNRKIMQAIKLPDLE